MPYLRIQCIRCKRVHEILGKLIKSVYEEIKYLNSLVHSKHLGEFNEVVKKKTFKVLVKYGQFINSEIHKFNTKP